MSPIRLGLPLILLATGSAACHTRPPAIAPSRTASAAPTAPARLPAPPSAPPVAAARPAPVASLSEAQRFDRTSLEELNSEHPLGDAFFDYDQIALRDDARRALQQDVQWLSKWPQTRIRIDGHCDERGTPEYNLAHGDRRAMAAEQYLTSLGIALNRIEVRSLGKDAPFCSEDNEACWSQNRRDHFLITAK